MIKEILSNLPTVQALQNSIPLQLMKAGGNLISSILNKEDENKEKEQTKQVWRPGQGIMAPQQENTNQSGRSKFYYPSNYKGIIGGIDTFKKFGGMGGS